MLNGVLNKWLLRICLLVLVISCNPNWEMPPELMGAWESDKAEITVRTENKPFDFEFTRGSGVITVVIYEDKTASGTIGLASFENVEIKKNPGIPSITGIAYIIKCGKVSEIFAQDPLSSKEVEIWLSPMKENNIMEAELRYTEGGAHFPMTGFNLKKVE